MKDLSAVNRFGESFLSTLDPREYFLLYGLVNLYINKYHTDTITEWLSGSWDAMVKNIRSKFSVSEVIGVVLLLGMAISLFAVLNLFVSSFSLHQSGPLVSLMGTIDKENSVIDIKNNGGESLEGTTNITITIGTSTYQKSVREILNHTSTEWKLLVSSTDKNPDKWDFGETVQFSFKGTDITDKYIQAMVVDPSKNTVLLSVVLQQGVSR